MIDRKYLIFFVLCLLLCSVSEASERSGDKSSLIFKVEYSTNRHSVNESNSILTYNIKTGTQPQVITGNYAILDITPTNKPPNIINTNNLFNFSKLTTEVVWAALSLVLNNSYGTIDFEETIDISRRETVDLDSYVDISSNYIYINDIALSELNKSAIVTIRDLTFSNIRVLKNGEDCLGCTIISYLDGDVKFSVPGFAIYQGADGSVSPAIRIATNVIVTNTSMNITGDTYNNSYPTNVTIDVGNDGTAEFRQNGEFNSSTVFTNFTDILNDMLPECSCSGCTLSNNNLTCTIELNITSDSAGTIELFNLNVSQIIKNVSWEEDNNYSLIDLDDYFYDIDRDTLSYSYSSVENISISIVSGLVTLIPDSNFYGNRTIFFNASDGTNTTLSSNVTVSILPVYEVYRGNYDGRTTDFSALSSTQLQNISNLIIEKRSYGMINFTQTINISEDIDLNLHVNISYNRIFLNSTNITEFNKSATLYLYNLTLSSPRIIRDGEVCPSTICTILSYTHGNLTFNVTGWTVYSAGETPIVAPIVGERVGVAAPEVTMPVKRPAPVKEFSLSLDSLKIKLVTDGSKKKELVITNTGNVKLDFSIDIKAVDDFLFISEKEFELDAGQYKSITIDIIAGAKYGIYTGEIVVKADGIEKIIPVVLEIVTRKRLFDVKIDIPAEYKEIYPGEKLKTQITLFNMIGGTSDVLINYFIKNMEGYVVYEESETFAVEDQVSYTKEFDTGKDWQTGDYLVAIEVMYGNSYAVSSEIFKLKGILRLSPEVVRGGLTSILIIVVIIVCVMVLSVLMEMEARKKKRKR